MLRPAHAAAKQGCLGMLKRLLPRLREAFPKARLRIRLDSGFSGPELYDWFESEGLEYVVSMVKNNVLTALAEAVMAVVHEDADNDIETICTDESQYAAHSWSQQRRVIIKGQITYQSGRKLKDNPRFVVTNLKGSPQRVYEKIYCTPCISDWRRIAQSVGAIPPNINIGTI